MAPPSAAAILSIERIAETAARDKADMSRFCPVHPKPLPPELMEFDEQGKVRRVLAHYVREA
jgi:hypothetical protein